MSNRTPFVLITCSFWLATIAPAYTAQVTTLSYGPDDAQVVDLYTPDSAPKEAMPTVVLAHGGLWQSGGRDALSSLCKNIVSLSGDSIACTSIDYRLSHDLGGVCTGTGTATYLEQVKDMALAYALLQSNAARYGLDPNQMHVGGHSAGAQLAQTFNLRWSEFAQACTLDEGCPAAISAIGLEGIYDIPAWNHYDVSFWQGQFECATRKAFGAPGPSPAACLESNSDNRCWDSGSPAYLARNAKILHSEPVGDVLLIHSSGDNWVDIAEAENFAQALNSAFPEIDVVVKTDGSCAIGQHNDMLNETLLAECVIKFVNGRLR